MRNFLNKVLGFFKGAWFFVSARQTLFLILTGITVAGGFYYTAYHRGEKAESAKQEVVQKKITKRLNKEYEKIKKSIPVDRADSFKWLYDNSCERHGSCTILSPHGDTGLPQ